MTSRGHVRKLQVSVGEFDQMVRIQGKILIHAPSALVGEKRCNVPSRLAKGLRTWRIGKVMNHGKRSRHYGAVEIRESIYCNRIFRRSQLLQLALIENVSSRRRTIN